MVSPLFTVYVLKSSSSSRLYTGHTADLHRRLYEHQHGLARYTKSRGPWQLVHQEEYPTRSEAMVRERYLKSGAGRAWLHNRLMVARIRRRRINR